MHDHPYDAPAEIDRLRSIADEHRLGPSTAAIVEAARRRRIPVLRLAPGRSLVQLGYGAHQKRILASETSHTSAIAVDLCQEKPMTNRMLRAVGLPVPEGAVASSAEAAVEVARSIGFPVVAKPHAGNQGKGVAVNLDSDDDVRGAYEVAARFDPQVLVERTIAGLDFRMLVVNGRMIAAARRDPAHVVGNGRDDVAELVRQVNEDPRRRPGHANPLTRILLDDAADLVLRQQGLARTDVPEPDRVVLLRRNGNLSTGGTAADVTDEVHPRNAQMAELAAQILNLDVAGIDVLCKDIGVPLHEQGGAIVEVNAAPGLRMHLHPSSGRARPVGDAIAEMLFPDPAAARIPIVAVTGTNGKTTVTRLVAHMFQTARWAVGMTTTDGVYILGERIMKGDCAGPVSARAVLLHPRVEVAVLETARGGILRAGLGYDGCDVGIVTNVSGDHLGMGGIDTLEELARVKQVVIDAVHGDGVAVLNAQDPLVAAMAADTEARVVYFSLDPRNPVFVAHLAEGGSGVTIEDGAMVLCSDTRTEIVEVERLRFTHGGRVPFQIANALAATAAAWGAGLNPAILARALSTFRTDTATVPGRFNVLEVEGVEIVLDYGHNEAALSALGAALDALGERHTLLVLGLPGDRKDDDLARSLRAALGFANALVLHDFVDRRGRAPGEVPRLLATLVPPNVPVEMADDQLAAVQRAWSRMRPGQRLVVIADEVDEAIAMIRSLSPRDEAACETPLHGEP
jgi:cyanophycin synthetase